ncbi:DUF4340 domain-containing protein [Candidatus Poribacteria bacterium]|nr:DUF4340 domain-containing protein [Candidatus Poribacteria bacterium]
MQKKKLLILGGILAVLALIVLIFENPFGKSQYEKKVEEATVLFPDFNRDMVSKVEITANGETTILTKQGENWVVTTMDDYPADSEGINDLFTKVEEFTNTNLVSDNPKNQVEFEVNSAGVEAKLMGADDKLLAHLFVGKNTPGFLSSYVRAADSNNVYVGQGNLQSVFDKGTRTWKDRSIFNFNKGIVTQVNITSAEENVELRLDSENKWQMLKPTASDVKQTEIDSLLTTLSELKTDDFAEKKDLSEYGLDAPISSISASLNDGSTATLIVGKEEGGKHYVKSNDNQTVFMLFKSNVDRLIKKSETLKEVVTPPETEETTPSEAVDVTPTE